MVARGDLGVEMGAEKVPLIQKRAIELTNAKGKIVITATQMLESMITNPRPTRAEASDVANAVLDGSDALMLSGETASGKYPLLAVRTMARIIEEIEDSARFKSRFDAATLDFATSANAIAKAAVVAARQLGASAIACVTESGGVARLVSEYRPEARLVAFTSQQDVYRRLALYWGVEPVMAAAVAELRSAARRHRKAAGVRAVRQARAIWSCWWSRCRSAPGIRPIRCTFIASRRSRSRPGARCGWPGLRTSATWNC